MNHDISQFIDPETGWRECYCRKFTEPIEGEPHDEYSACCTDLIEVYTGIICKSFKANSSYASIKSAKFITAVAPILHRKSPEYLKQLIVSARASNPDHLNTHLNLSEGTLDTSVLLGVHLSTLGYRIIDEVTDEYIGIAGQGHKDEMPFMRAAAQLYSRLERVPIRGLGYNVNQALLAVCPVLKDKPELIPTVAALFNSQGVNESTAERALDLLNGDGRASVTSLIEGTL